MLDLKPLKLAVCQAAELTRRVQALQLSGAHKDGQEPVTLADYGSQAILCRALKDAFPHDGIMAEETAEQFLTLVSPSDRAQIVRMVGEVLGEHVTQGDLVRWIDQGRDREAERVWAVDPIDGTKGFIAGRRYSVAVGAMEGGLPVAGILACPGYPSRDGRGILFYAQRSAAYAEPLAGGKPVRVAVRPPAGLNGVRVVESAEESHVDHGALKRVLAAAGLKNPAVQPVDGQDKYAMVADGDAQVYLRLRRDAQYQYRLWDHLTGTAIVQAAGGSVTDLDGSMLDFSRGRILSANRGMVVSPGGAFHERLLKAVDSAFLNADSQPDA
ncbi:MAG TPA: inositol monophosphatase family protein [Candidatus Limnocylindrales bacterium]|nr:inositol monophosphatase family protein [Candidatus Limnocylindrales bacterium]